MGRFLGISQRRPAFFIPPIQSIIYVTPKTYYNGNKKRHIVHEIEEKQRVKFQKVTVAVLTLVVVGLVLIFLTFWSQN